MINHDVSQCNMRDNRGFSLVELIVCIAILAVATVPLYQSMTVSTRATAKAQSKQNATSLAEEVMEEIKATSIHDLQVRYGGLTTDIDSETGENIPVALGYTEDDFWINGSDTGYIAAAQHLAGKTSDVMLTSGFKTDTPFYVLYKPGAFSTQDNEKFNVIATMSTKTYADSGAANAANANIKKLPRIEEVDALSQAVISTKEFTKYDVAALDYFRQDGDSHITSVGIAKKEIVIEKFDTPGAIYDQVSVNCRVIYTSTPVTVAGSTETKVKTYSKDLFSGTYGQSVVTDDEGNDHKLPLASNIYLFYRRTQMQDPDTPLSTVTIQDEIITVKDKATKGTHKVYLVMQDDSAGNPVLKIKQSDALKTEVHVVKVEDGGGGTETETAVIDFTENDQLGEDDGNIKSAVDDEFELITNMTKEGTSAGHVYNEEAHIRIYDVNVSLVKDISKDTTEYAHLHSTKEANDENKH